MAKELKDLTKRSENYSQWYNDLVVKADLAEQSAVRGCMVIKPYGYAIWEKMQRQLDDMFKETGHMKARYVFEYRLSEFEKNLIFNHNILPKPCGVEVSITELPVSEYFGFYKTGFQPFNQAPFIK